MSADRPHLLVTSVGRRSYVVDALLQARPSGGVLSVADANVLAPGMHVAGVHAAFTLPPITAPEYDAAVVEQCVRRGITALLSLNDFEIARLAAVQTRLREAGVAYIGPGASMAAALLDKLALPGLFGSAHDLSTPPTWSLDDPDALSSLHGAGPCIVKHRWGSGSSGLAKVASVEEAVGAATAAHRWVHPTLGEINAGSVVQPWQEGVEFNLDVFCDWEGRPRDICVKRKIAMRNGETDSCEVLGSPPVAFESLAEELASIGDLVGNVDVDVIVAGPVMSVIDVNPRFGGGYAFAERAGYAGASHVWSLVGGTADRIGRSPVRSLVAAKTIQVVTVRDGGSGRPPPSGGAVAATETSATSAVVEP